VNPCIPHYRRKVADTADWKIDDDFFKYFEDDDLMKEFGLKSSKLTEDYCWPSKGDEQIFQSLKFHAQKNREARGNMIPPTLVEERLILNALEEYFRPVILDYWKQPKREFSVGWFSDALREVDLDSSPGWPWKGAGYQTNREFLFKPDGELNKQNVVLLFEAVNDRLNKLREGVASDDINLFIKDELHKRKKRVDGAWRLIASVGLTDCMVDRFLFGDFFNSMYKPSGWTTTPNKAGWSPVKGGYKWFYKRYGGRRVLMADKSAWDWTVQEWVVNLIRDFMVRVLCTDRNGVHDKNLARLISNRFDSLFAAARFNVGGYLVFEQFLAGIMKSGCLGTIAWNGIGQLILDVLAKLRMGLDLDNPPDVMGDDTSQLEPCYPNGEYCSREFCDQLQMGGCVVKEFAVADTSDNEPIEFAGTSFNAIKAVPAYRVKHLAMLMTACETRELKAEALGSYQRLYAFDDFMFPRLTRWLIDLGGEAVTRDYAQDWYNGLVGRDDLNKFY